MADRLLCERDVLVMTGWPSRKYLDGRIRSDGFPRPRRRFYAIGDQWLESDIQDWMLGSARPGRNPMMEKFALGNDWRRANRGEHEPIELRRGGVM